jgi:hypothetical protein
VETSISDEEWASIRACSKIIRAVFAWQMKMKYGGAGCDMIVERAKVFGFGMSRVISVRICDGVYYQFNFSVVEGVPSHGYGDVMLDLEVLESQRIPEFLIALYEKAGRRICKRHICLDDNNKESFGIIPLSALRADRCVWPYITTVLDKWVFPDEIVKMPYGINYLKPTSSLCKEDNTI